jgi:hypothetical protein
MPTFGSWIDETAHRIDGDAGRVASAWKQAGDQGTRPRKYSISGVTSWAREQVAELEMDLGRLTEAMFRLRRLYEGDEDMPDSAAPRPAMQPPGPEPDAEAAHAAGAVNEGEFTGTLEQTVAWPEWVADVSRQLDLVVALIGVIGRAAVPDWVQEATQAITGAAGVQLEAGTGGLAPGEFFTDAGTDLAASKLVTSIHEQAAQAFMPPADGQELAGEELPTPEAFARWIGGGK